VGVPLQFIYIQDYEALKDVCAKLAQAQVIAVDTEFVRTRTLFPKLGLIQVCDGEHVILIDPLALLDLSPFWRLIEDPSIVKVLHACSEDLEVFLTVANCRPQNLIDSQIMMAFLGRGLSVGYAAMVKHFLDIDLDKSDSRTDWTKRPLTDSQLMYAQADVTHLIQIYPKLLAEIEKTPWLEAVKQESALMIEKKFTPLDESTLYYNVKMSWRLNPKQLNALKHLAIWRYEQAKKKNLPIGFIAKDHTLIGVAQRLPTNMSAMFSIEGAEQLDIKHKGKIMLSVLQKASKVPEEEYPSRITRLDEYPGYKQVFKRIKNFVQKMAKQHEVLPENMASKKQINQFLTWHYKLNGQSDCREQIELLRDWRFELVGEQLLLAAKNNFSTL